MFMIPANRSTVIPKKRGRMRSRIEVEEKKCDFIITVQALGRLLHASAGWRWSSYLPPREIREQIALTAAIGARARQTSLIGIC
jgi:predicted nuclease of restriction endonuclease-like RecB superfamily